MRRGREAARLRLPLALAAALLLLASLPRPADAFRLEAEAFESGGSSHNAGGLGISITPCDAASPFGAGIAVEGFDADGDWIKVPFSLNGQMYTLDSLRTARALGEAPATVRVDIVRRSDDLVVASDLLTTGIGLGIG